MQIFINARFLTQPVTGVQRYGRELVKALDDLLEQGLARAGQYTFMLEHAQRPDVGAVGAKLLYPDRRIQHAGVVVGVAGGAVHAFRQWPGEPNRGLRLADLIRDCSAVTAACMMVPRSVFEETKGFDEAFRVAFNDVDLCLRILVLGRRVVYTPRALLLHWEGATRGRLHPAADQRLFERRWAAVIRRGDPYYHPALTDTRDDWSLRL